MTELATIPPIAPLPLPPEIPLPPTQAELPYDDGIPLESSRHRLQMELLIQAMQRRLEQLGEGYVGGNMFVYFSMAQVRNQDFRGPDVYIALGVSQVERLSWVVWEEGKAPDVVIELLSSSTASDDKGIKKQAYQNQLRVPEYYWYDPFNPDDWAGFRLEHGCYQPIVPNAQGQLESQVLGLSLVRWQGTYSGITTTWLRWATPEGTLLPIPDEIAEQAQQERDLAQQERDLAQNQIRQIVQNLHQQGMSTAQIAQITGLSEQDLDQL